MIDKDALKYGDIIWQVDINGSDVSLRKIEVGHLHCVAGSIFGTQVDAPAKVPSSCIKKRKIVDKPELKTEVFCVNVNHSDTTSKSLPVTTWQKLRANACTMNTLSLGMR